MQKLKKIVNMFSPYAIDDEKTVQTFFRSLTENSNKNSVSNRLLELIQNNVACINLWSEYKFKGYRYLTKKNRAKLYHNLRLIEADFANFLNKPDQKYNPLNFLTEELRTKSPPKSPELDLLCNIMAYFSIERGVYVYKSSSSFGKLLQDPDKSLLIGDCNQIVTLYIHIYSRYFNVSDLKITTIPNHVALHFKGIDIEATKGVFADYSNNKESNNLPIQEIVSINLLDITDSYLKTKPINPKDLLQSSRLAYLLSSNRELVTQNLNASYSIIVNDLISQHNYDSAITFAKQSNNTESLNLIGHNGAIYYLSKHNFSKARQLAKYSKNNTELIKHSYQAEGEYHFNKNNFDASIKAFNHIGDQKSIQACYEALFIREQGKLPKNLNSENIKNSKNIINKMKVYANKSNNKSMIENANQYSKYL